MYFNIAFDIDHMLAFHMVEDIQQAHFIHQTGAILSEADLKTHYIYPGVLELIKLAYDREDVRVSFFSKGSARRNRRFVQLLLDKALPEAKYNEKKAQTRIFSKDHLTKTPSGTQKDLFHVLEEGDALEDALLIDDRPRNSVAGQESNFLQVPVVDWEDYDSLIDKVDDYEPYGTRFLKCQINVNGSIDLEENAVEKARRIFVYKNEDDFMVKFLDRNNQVQMETVRDPLLIEALMHQHQEAVGGADAIFQIKDRQTILGICRLVANSGGRTRKICRRANRICYVTGLLFAALSYAKANETSLSYALFTQQFKEENGYRVNFKDDHVYLQGYKKLKEVNPNFQLISPVSYNEMINSFISENDRQYLQKVLDNEHFVIT